jgi:predicted Rossmann fold flavoprotein
MPVSGKKYVLSGLKKLNKYTTAVIGGGAAGICAAIAAARRGQSVVICEKMPQLGKKLLATGNGRCNLLNEKLDETFYNLSARPTVKAVFEQIGKSAILEFFSGLGLQTTSKEGRLFPATNQASSVLKVLDIELKRLAVALELDFDCSSISFGNNSITLSASDQRKVECSKAIVTGGGRTYPAYGSDGSIYKIARQLGYALVEPVPSVVPLVVKDKLCSSLQGQKITAGVKPLIESKAGREAQGELLFTAYGLSGSVILDVSEGVSIALNRLHKTDVGLVIDFVPFMEPARLQEELTRRQKAGWQNSEMLVGILPNRVSLAFKEFFKQGDIASAVHALKSMVLTVSGTRGWNEAEFTSGGIEVSQINPITLESRIHAGLFFAGEVLDVNGPRGGYNLAWAWASGLVAGMN